jgi:hypothetical protein
MTAPKGGPNERAIRRTVAELRRCDRLDEVSSAVAVLAMSTAHMVDQAVDDPKTMGYAKAKIAVCHLSVLSELHALVAGVGTPTDAYAELIQGMTVAQAGETYRADYFRRHRCNPPGFEKPYDWDAAPDRPPSDGEAGSPAGW